MLYIHSVYVAFEAFPRPKGASSHIASMVEVLASMGESGDKVLLLCLGYGDMPSFQEEGDIIIRRLKEYHPNLLKRAELFLDFVRDSLLALDSKPERIVFRDPWGGIPAIETGSASKVVFEVNGLPSWELEYTWPGINQNLALVHKIMDMEIFCLRNCDAVLTVSSVTAERLPGKGADQSKIKTIPNSAPDVFFDVESNADRADKQWMGYVGSLHPWQGVEDGIDAFALISDQQPDLNMMIVGAGKKDRVKAIRKKSRKLGLEDRVVLWPPVPQCGLPDIAKQFSFTIAPLKETYRNTYQGCCPVKVIESMAMGIPVIASDLACLSGIISHQADGVLYPPGKKRSLAYHLLQLATDDDFRQRLSANARNKAKNKFSRTVIHHDLRAFFNELNS